MKKIHSHLVRLARSYPKLRPYVNQIGHMLREAGTIEAPPVLVENVKEFVVDVLGSWTLQEINRGLPHYRDQAKRHPDNTFKNTRLVDTIRLKKYLERQGFRAEKRQEERSVFDVDLDGWKYLRTYKQDLDKVLDKQARQVERSFSEVKKKLQSSNKEAIFVNLPFLGTKSNKLFWLEADVLFWKKQGTYTLRYVDFRSTAKGAPAVKKENNMIDLEGTLDEVMDAYQEDVIETILDRQADARKVFKDTDQFVEGILAGIQFDRIMVQMNPKNLPKPKGTWDFGRKKINLYLSETPKNLKRYQQLEDSLKDTARHECQHVAQDLIRVLKNLHERGGLPALNLRNPEYNTSGQKIDDKTQMQPHALREIEFQTRLTDDIEAFKRDVKPKIPSRLLRTAVRLWTGTLQEEDLKKMDSEDAKRLRKELGYKVYGGSDFFQKLKEHAPDSWKEATKDFVSEVL